MIEITLQDLKDLCPTTRRLTLARMVEPINETLPEFELTTTLRIAAFLAQTAHESMGFSRFSEIASGKAYDNNIGLGNTEPAAIRIAHQHGSTPGQFWKGHGPIQITGYYNHLHCGQALGLDLVNEPTLLEEPTNGFRGAGWFWRVKKLNYYADIPDFPTITRRINGGTNGARERTALYNKMLDILEAQWPDTPL